MSLCWPGKLTPGTAKEPRNQKVNGPNFCAPHHTANDAGLLGGNEASVEIRKRVIAARQRQHERFKNKPRINCNARMGSREIKACCALDESTLELLKFAMSDLKLSARGYDRVLKVARTIADLAGSETITGDHLSEAIQYRSLDRQLWT